MPRVMLALAVVAAFAATPAIAASCDDAAWDAPAVTELLAGARPATADAPLARTDVTAFRLDLAPQGEVAFALPPERAPRKTAPRAGVMPFAGGAAGTYRVALSAAAWIDVVQDGAPVSSTAHTDFPDCPQLRKIVAFDIGPGPFTLQLSDAEVASIAVAVVSTAH